MDAYKKPGTPNSYLENNFRSSFHLKMKMPFSCGIAVSLPLPLFPQARFTHGYFHHLSRGRLLSYAVSDDLSASCQSNEHHQYHSVRCNFCFETHWATPKVRCSISSLDKRELTSHKTDPFYRIHFERDKALRKRQSHSYVFLSVLSELARPIHSLSVNYARTVHVSIIFGKHCMVYHSKFILSVVLKLTRYSLLHRSCARGAHIFPYGEDIVVYIISLDTEGELNSTRNGLFLRLTSKSDFITTRLSVPWPMWSRS